MDARSSPPPNAALRAQGVEYNPDMVDLAKRNATTAGVGDKAQFVRATSSRPTSPRPSVITLFLLPNLNLRLRPTILNMKPGTRIVSNSFTMDDPSTEEDWVADQTETVTNCTSWCTALLWIVPAKVAGTWKMGDGTLTLDQKFQNFSGTARHCGRSPTASSMVPTSRSPPAARPTTARSTATR